MSPLLLLLLTIWTVNSEGLVIEPSSTNCSITSVNRDGSLSDGMISLQNTLGNITSNSILMLKPGCHYIQEYTGPIVDIVNVTIEGLGEYPDNTRRRQHVTPLM